MADNPPFSLDGLHIISHPLVNAKLSLLRQASTSPKEFREVCPISLVSALNVTTERSDKGIYDLSLIVGVEASRNLEETTFQGVSYNPCIHKPSVLCSLDHPCRGYLYRNNNRARDRACADIACRIGDD